MTTKLNLKLLFLFSYLVFCGCTTSPAYQLKMRLQKGDTFPHDIKMNMEMSYASMNMKMQMETSTLFEVLNSDASAKQLKMTYQRAHMNMDMGMPGLKKMGDSALNVANNRIIGKSVILLLSPDNQIDSVSGADVFTNNDSSSLATNEMMKKMFSKESINNLFGLLFSMYPKKSVKIGDTWDAATTVDLAGIKMNTTIKYTLKSVHNSLAELAVDGKITGKGQMTTGASQMEMAMDGNQTGTITINLEDGYLHNGAYKMEVKGTMSVMGMKMPLTMKGDYSLNGK